MTRRANATEWVLLEHENSNDEAVFSSDVDLESDLSPESDGDSPSIEPPKPNVQETTWSDLPNSVHSRKRRADNDVAAFESSWSQARQQPLTDLQAWSLALAMSLEKLPPSVQIEVKMTFANIIGKKELEMLVKSEGK